MKRARRSKEVLDTARSLAIALCLVSCSTAEAITTSDDAPEVTPEVMGDGVLERFVQANGVRLRVSERGEGPAVMLLHGFPELALSWRSQLRGLAEAGYRAIAPDMRGYGESEAPASIDAYDMVTIASDVVGVLDALGEEQCVLVGHDWGAVVAWYAVLLYPERFRGLAALSVPFGGRGSKSPLSAMRDAYGENFFYMLYFQEPGVAEAELDADPRGVFERFFASLGAPREPATITSPRADAGGLLGRIGRPTEPPTWIEPEVFDRFVATFERTGFRGGLNYYRNFDRTWERTADLAGAQIDVPVMFMAGEQDLVIAGRDRASLEAQMRPIAPKLVDVRLFPNTGHWVQQERAGEVNAALLEFLAAL